MLTNQQVIGAYRKTFERADWDNWWGFGSSFRPR